MPSTKEIFSRARAISSNDKMSSCEIGEASFRVYYGATGAAVPFTWESQPGTPKHPIFRTSDDENDHNIPPLTPPPSYTTSSLMTLGHSSSKCRKSRVFDIFLSLVSRKNSDVTPTSSLSSIMSSSSSSSTTSSAMCERKIINSKKCHRRNASFSSFGSKKPLFGDDEDYNDMGSPNNSKIMCFGFKKKYKGCYSMQDMKNAILCIRGH